MGVYERHQSPKSEDTMSTESRSTDGMSTRTEAMVGRTLTASGRMPTPLAPSLSDHARAARTRSAATVDRAILEEQARAGAR